MKVLSKLTRLIWPVVLLAIAALASPVAASGFSPALQARADAEAAKTMIGLAAVVIPGTEEAAPELLTAEGEGSLGFTFRGDAQSPDVVFNQGFSAKGTSTDLYAHSLDSSSPPSAFISTSTSPDVAAGFANNVYVVRPVNGINVNQALGPLSPFPRESEIAVPWQISPGNVRGVTLPQQGVSILNPNWKP